MKKFMILGIVVFGAVFVSSFANALSIDDNYFGGDDWRGLDPHYAILPGTDVVGTEDQFGISKMDVTIQSDVVTVDIYSRFFDNIQTNVIGALLGDLFISTDDWTPFGTAASNYNLDVPDNGEDWEYALVLDDHGATGNTGGSLSLYSVDPNNIAISGGAYTSSYRLGQEILYEATASETDLLELSPKASWQIYYGITGDQDDYLRFTFSNTIGLNINNFALRWTMTCANDIIEGGSPVPEPSTLLLFGVGAIGLAGSALRRKKK